MKRHLSATLLAATWLTACQPPHDAGTPVLSYTDAFILEPVGGRDMTVGGIEISVSGGDVRLVSVTTDAASAVETHTMSMEGGKMEMRPVGGFDIKDGETLDLDRGGNHLMLFGVQQGLAPGDTVDLVLIFETGGDERLTLNAEAEIRGLGD